jgi:hypothetical protein
MTKPNKTAYPHQATFESPKHQHQNSLETLKQQPYFETIHFDENVKNAQARSSPKGHYFFLFQQITLGS